MTKQKGFTLIELLIVIAIIGVLASIVLLSLGDARISARDQQRVANIRNAQLAMELYHNDNGGYPGASGCEDPITQGQFDLVDITGITDPQGEPWLYGADDLIDGDATDYVLGAALEDVDNMPGGDVDGADVYGCNCDGTGGNAYCVQP